MSLALAEPPFTRKRTGPHYVWASDLIIAHAFAAENGLTLFLSDARHQVAKLIGDKVKLVIYPHKTTSNNYHLRVRGEASADKSRAQELMVALDRAAGFNCTFSQHINLSADVRRLRSGAFA